MRVRTARLTPIPFRDHEEALKPAQPTPAAFNVPTTPLAAEMRECSIRNAEVYRVDLTEDVLSRSPDGSVQTAREETVQRTLAFVPRDRFENPVNVAADGRVSYQNGAPAGLDEATTRLSSLYASPAFHDVVRALPLETLHLDPAAARDTLQPLARPIAAALGVDVSRVEFAVGDSPNNLLTLQTPRPGSNQILISLDSFGEELADLIGQHGAGNHEAIRSALADRLVKGVSHELIHVGQEQATEAAVRQRPDGQRPQRSSFVQEPSLLRDLIQNTNGLFYLDSRAATLTHPTLEEGYLGSNPTESMVEYILQDLEYRLPR